jgi:hypothetical protein
MRITKKQLAGVDQYKYSGVDKSILSRYVLGPFWTWLVTCFPRTLAPNMVSGTRRGVVAVLRVRDEEVSGVGGKSKGKRGKSVLRRIHERLAGQKDETRHE